jgi:hypothetical protein
MAKEYKVSVSEGYDYSTGTNRMRVIAKVTAVENGFYTEIVTVESEHKDLALALLPYCMAHSVKITVIKTD